MSTTRVDSSQATVTVDQTRARQTAKPATPFADVLTGGANALLTGAEVAGGALGGPVVAAAIRQARTSVGENSSVGVAGAGGGGGGSVVGGGSVPGADAVLNPSAPGGEMAAIQAMNRQSQQFNMQMLALQEDVQNENRRFTTLTNTIRAKHDTVKAAISNVRS